MARTKCGKCNKWGARTEPRGCTCPPEIPERAAKRARSESSSSSTSSSSSEAPRNQTTLSHMFSISCANFANEVSIFNYCYSSGRHGDAAAGSRRHGDAAAGCPEDRDCDPPAGWPQQIKIYYNNSFCTHIAYSSQANADLEGHITALNAHIAQLLAAPPAAQLAMTRHS